MQSIAPPTPRIETESDRIFWEGVRAGELRISRCSVCDRHYHPRSQCGCENAEMEWVKASGRGEVYTYVIYHRAMHPAFADRVPYNVAWVMLEEGVLILTNIIGDRPPTVGMSVKLCFSDSDQPLPLFTWDSEEV